MQKASIVWKCDGGDVGGGSVGSESALSPRGQRGFANGEMHLGACRMAWSK